LNFFFVNKQSQWIKQWFKKKLKKYVENEQLFWKGMSFKVYWMNEQKTIKILKQILKNLMRPLAKQYFFYKFHFAWKFSTNLLILKISIKWIEPNLYWCKRFHKTWAKLHKIEKIYRNFVFGGNLLLTQVTNPRKVPGIFHWEIWLKYSEFPSLLLKHCLGFGLGFPANKTFRDKMRKFLVRFCKLFHEILHFFRK